jgi:outer membrane immunogenic protein
MKQLYILTLLAVVGGAAAPAAASEWSGGFIGIGIGNTFDSESPNSANLPFEGVTGFYGGPQAGFNFQNGAFVFGPEAEINIANLESDTRVGAPFNTNVKTKVRWKGLIGGRVGVANGDFLPFLKGGFAFGNTEVTIAANGATDDQTQTGYYIGGGVEFRTTERVSIRGEYIYVDLQEEAFFNGAEFGYNGSDIRVSLNYRF